MKLSIALALVAFVILLVQNTASEQDVNKQPANLDSQEGSAAVKDVSIEGVKKVRAKSPTLRGHKKIKKTKKSKKTKKAGKKAAMVAELSKIRKQATVAGKDPVEALKSFVLGIKQTHLDEAKKFLGQKTPDTVEKRILSNLEKRIEKLKKGRLPSHTKLAKWLVMNTTAKLKYYAKKLERKRKMAPLNQE